MPEEAFDVVYRPAGRSWRKVSFEPRADGWERRTYEWTGCTWRYTGSELVEDVRVETADGEVEPAEVKR